jgi:NADH dehydrogenase
MESSGSRLVILVTGAGGFVGRRLLARLAGDPRYRLRGLVRRLPTRPNPDVEWIQGDLRNPESYRGQLSDVDQVIHLGAAVGRCRREDYSAINDRGTADLVRLCRAAGVGRILHVSTIAVRFSNLDVYPYAASKRRAEQHVQASGLPFQIVRPTIVLGSDGPSWQALAKLARLPLTPIFGSGETHVQPIDVDDLADCLIELSGGPIDESIVELGGPEVTTIGDLLRRIHRQLAAGPFRPWRWPLAVVARLAGMLEAVLGTRAPLTRGQLSVFGYDSTAQTSRFFEQRRDRLRSIDSMIARAAGPTGEQNGAPDSGCHRPSTLDSSSAAAAPDAASDDQTLRAECRHLHSYLFDCEPAERVWFAYHRAHQLQAVNEATTDEWDRRLLRAVRRYPWLCRTIDSYCRIFAPGALLRRKLVLLLAIAEWEPSLNHHVQLDRPVSRPLVALRIAIRLAAAALLAFLAAIVLTPWKWFAANAASSRPLAGD